MQQQHSPAGGVAQGANTHPHVLFCCTVQAAATAEVQPSSVQLQSLDKRRRGAPWHVLLRACATRLFKVDLARNWEACAIRWMLALLMAVIMGVLFLQLPVSFVGGTNLLGMLFQGLFFLQMLSLPSIEVTFEKRPILFQQRDDLLYPAWVRSDKRWACMACKNAWHGDAQQGCCLPACTVRRWSGCLRCCSTCPSWWWTRSCSARPSIF